MKRLLAALLAICLLTTFAFAEGGEGQPPAPPAETPQPAAAPPAEAPKPATHRIQQNIKQKLSFV